jgi:hypothetical protein
MPPVTTPSTLNPKHLAQLKPMKNPQKYLVPALVVFTFTCLVRSAEAQISIPVPNSSFETPAATTAGTAGTSSGAQFDTSESDLSLIDDWTGTGNVPGGSEPIGVVNNSVLTTAGTSDASQSAFFQVYYNGEVSTLTTNNSLGTIAPDTTYTLTVALGSEVNRTTMDGASGAPTGDVAAQEDISLLANGAAAATFTLVNTAVPVGTEADYTASFTTGASGGFIGDALTIQLEADKAFYPGGVDPGSEEAMFDNVRLSETPEPSTWALMLGGMGFLVLLARRNFRRV